MVWDPQDICCLLGCGEFEGGVSEEALKQLHVCVDGELSLGSRQLVGSKEGGVREGLTASLLGKNDTMRKNWQPCKQAPPSYCTQYVHLKSLWYETNFYDLIYVNISLLKYFRTARLVRKLNVPKYMHSINDYCSTGSFVWKLFNAKNCCTKYSRFTVIYELYCVCTCGSGILKFPSSFQSGLSRGSVRWLSRDQGRVWQARSNSDLILSERQLQVTSSENHTFKNYCKPQGCNYFQVSNSKKPWVFIIIVFHIRKCLAGLVKISLVIL